VARRKRAEKAADTSAEDVERYYRERLEGPAVAPWDGTGFAPLVIGPTWRREGGRWVLPELTLGWDALVWGSLHFQLNQSTPWRYTDEQARWILWWYAIEPNGDFVYVDGVLQRLKGWGKDPLAAALCFTELLGPVRFDGFEDDRPVGRDVPDAWVQIAATSKDQTKNTTRLFNRLVTKATIAEYALSIGKELTYSHHEERMIQALTSSPGTLEGARSTFVIRNETQHWTAANEGHEMADVIARNNAKSPEVDGVAGGARALSITNASDDAIDSVGKRDRDAIEAILAGRNVDTGLMYDSLEAPDDAPLDEEHIPLVVHGVRGDSTWLSPRRIIKFVLDPRNPVSRSRRFFYNSKSSAEDAMVPPYAWAARARPDIVVSSREAITLGFDGSKSRAKGTADATALIACRVSDGHVFEPLDYPTVWEPPRGEAGRQWVAPADLVNMAVADVFKRYRVVGFFADPARWETYVAQWEAAYGTRLLVKSTVPHPIAWWMTGGRTSLIVRANDAFSNAIFDGEMTHDGSTALTRHVRNVRRLMTPSGAVPRKENPESADKVDAYVAAMLAWQARVLAVAAGVGKERVRAAPQRIR
jgi:hypothetical protein